MLRSVRAACFFCLCLGVWIAHPNGHAQTAGGGLMYGGGSVMYTLRAYAIFWAPPGHDFDLPLQNASSYQDLAARYLRDAGGTSFYNLLSQYSPPDGAPIQNQASFDGSAQDTSAYPRAGTDYDPLLDADIQAEVQKVATASSWQLNPPSAFFVFLPRGVQACEPAGGGRTCTSSADGGLCSWHSWFRQDGNPVVYAVLPEVSQVPGCAIGPARTSTPNGNLAADQEISYVSHEQFEMVTDPFQSAWRDGNGGEIADRCQGSFGPVAADGHNVTLHGHPYLLQEEWSNAAGGCALALDSPAEQTPALAPTAILPTATVQPAPVTEPVPSTTRLSSSTVTPTALSSPVLENCPSGQKLTSAGCATVRKSRRCKHACHPKRGHRSSRSPHSASRPGIVPR